MTAGDRVMGPLMPYDPSPTGDAARLAKLRHTEPMDYIYECAVAALVGLDPTSDAAVALADIARVSA